MNKILVIGGSGLLGNSIIENSPSKYEIISTYQNNSCLGKSIKLNLKNHDEIRKIIHSVMPDFVIHTAAMTNIEECEKNPIEAEEINVKSTKVLVESSKEIDAKFCYISTDAVFGGEKGNYKEDDLPNPINAYSLTKLLGEKSVLNYENSLVLRTSFFGFSKNKNKESFVPMVVRNLRNKKHIKAAVDKVNNPLEVSLLSKIIFKIYENEMLGLYNVASKDYMNSYEIANTIADVFEFDQKLISKITTNELANQFKWIAKRPLNTSLNTEKISKKISLPSIKDSIKILKSKGI